MKCYACGDIESIIVKRPDGWIYHQCDTCGSLYTDIGNSSVIQTQNDKKQTRNTPELHAVRLQRIMEALGHVPTCIVDKGCGDGEFVEYLREKGLDAFGIDLNGWYHNESPQSVPDVITMIEVIEHLTDTAFHLERAEQELQPGGVIYIETTFADHIKDPETDPYVDQTIGHVNVLSTFGLLIVTPESMELKWINNNVIILKKPGGSMKAPEAEKAHVSRYANSFYEKYMQGRGLDIGYKGATLGEPVLSTATGVDLDTPGYNGSNLPFDSESQDFVFSSHCLEHIENWQYAIEEWFRVLKAGGYLIITVPHQYLYEKKLATPSRWNGDHKRFYIASDLIQEIDYALPANHWRLRHCRDNDDHYDYTIPPDKHPGGCYEIELVIQKIAPPTWKVE